jgi:serine/threonine-protein kinase
MDRERWLTVRALFDELAELAPADRTGRLAELEARDPELRRVVGELLAADPMADPRLAASIVSRHRAAADPIGLVGQRVAGFQVLDVLGSGGMGVVYLARDTRLDRPVALKLPLPQFRLDTSARRRFLHEARAAAALDHPNLCAVHEVGESDAGLPFIAMALCAGESLKAHIARAAPLALADALEIARQTARGLGAVHQAGITHGDLKPGNLILLSDGTVKLLDFGLARAWNLAETESLTMRGTPAYMAPEQVSNTGFDPRTDLWALGVVLYEMLTGFQPFRGQSEISVAHAIVHDAPAPPRRLRADLPVPVQELVLALLEKQPERRPPSAALVADQLAALAAGQGARGAGWRTLRAKRWLAPAGLATLVAGVALGVGLRRGGAAPAREYRPGLVAVAPFNVRDPSLELWREGLADLLSRDLDGAGPLTTVPQSVVQQRWPGTFDSSSAAVLGARTGAELVLYGTLLRVNRDSVRLRATILDRGRGVTISDLEVAGSEAGIGGLADSLGILALQLLGQTRPIGSGRNVAFGARSLSSLKEYLRGEQFYRHGSWDSAAQHYSRAIAEDDSFALALKRMGETLSWDARTRAHYRPYEEYHARAMALNHGLSVRDSLLFLAESVRTSVGRKSTISDLVHVNRRAIDILETAVQRYPDDPEVWYDLGEARYHAAIGSGASARLAFESFARAAALDPGFSPSYEHLVPLALEFRQPDLALRYARASEALRPPGEISDLGIVAMLLEQPGPAAARLMAQARMEQLGNIAWTVMLSADSSEAAVTAARWFANGGADSGMTHILNRTWYQICVQAYMLAIRGHSHAADSVMRSAPPSVVPCERTPLDPFPAMALIGSVPDSEARSYFGASLRDTITWAGWVVPRLPRALSGIPWWYAHGDTLSIARLVARARPALRDTTKAIAFLRAEYVTSSAEGFLALARADTARAIEIFRTLPDSLCVVSPCVQEKVMLARLLAARGDYHDAADVLDRWGHGNFVEAPPVSIIPIALERGHVAEHLADTTTAVGQYRFVEEMWQHADPELQPYVREATAGLRRLSRDPSAGSR